MTQHQTSLMVILKPICLWCRCMPQQLLRAELSNEMLVFWVNLSAGCCHVKWPLCVSALAPQLHRQTKHNRIFQTSSHGSNYPVNFLQTSQNNPSLHNPAAPLAYVVLALFISRLLCHTAAGCLVALQYLKPPSSVCSFPRLRVTSWDDPGLNKSSLIRSDTQSGQLVYSTE